MAIKNGIEAGIENRPHHNCGVGGVSLGLESPVDAKLVLAAMAPHLHHRGPEGSGITVRDPYFNFMGIAGLGEVDQVMSASVVAGLPDAKQGVSHHRYPTQGGRGGHSRDELQPVVRDRVVMAMNGNVDGVIGDSPTDTHAMVDFIEQKIEAGHTFVQALVAMARFARHGSYSITAMDREGWLYAMRDPIGRHPLFYGYSRGIGGYVVASETPALRAAGVTQVMSVEPGSIVRFQPDQEPEVGYFVSKPRKARICALESQYFARVDGQLEGEEIYSIRKRYGESLARGDEDLDFDIVIAVPDSARAAAEGYAEALDTFSRQGIFKATAKRSFLQNSAKERLLVAGTKLQGIPVQLKDKKVVVIDDSIVRGSTMQELVNVLLNVYGVKEVHLRIASPPAAWPCKWGIDLPTKEEFIFNNLEGDIDAIADYFGAQSLRYLTAEQMRRAMGGEIGQRACATCFDGNVINTHFDFIEPRFEKLVL